MVTMFQNDVKTDYNIGGRDDKDPWDSMKIDWQKLKTKQPFFQVLNSTKSHESRAFGDVSKSTHDPKILNLQSTIRMYRKCVKTTLITMMHQKWMQILARH